MDILSWFSKSATSTALDISEILLLLFGVLLVAGLIGESAKSDRWKAHIRLFELFVIIGVAGELLADGGIFGFSKHLQTITETELAQLTRQAADAKTSADGAASAASRAKASADDANKAADQAKEKAVAAAKQADQAAANVGLTQALVSARIVADPNALIEQLKGFKGRTVVLISYAGDAEAASLCSALSSMARSAEMNTTDECGTGQLTVPLASNVVISGPDIQETLTLGQLISRVGRLGTISGIKAQSLTIFVGVKSPFVIGQTTAKTATSKQRK